MIPKDNSSAIEPAPPAKLSMATTAAEDKHRQHLTTHLAAILAMRPLVGMIVVHAFVVMT